MAKEAGLPVAAGPAVSGGVINLYLAGKLYNNDIWHSAQHQPDTRHESPGKLGRKLKQIRCYPLSSISEILYWCRIATFSMGPCYNLKKLPED